MDRIPPSWEDLREGDEVITSDVIKKVDAFLCSVPPPSPPPGSKTRLMSRLLAKMSPSPSFRSQMEQHRSTWGSMSSLVRVLRPQLGLMRPAFWLATFFLVAMGTLFSWAQETNGGLPIAVLAPFLAAVGMAYAFRGEESMREMEAAAVLGRFESAWARTLLVVAYNLLLLAPATLILHGSGTGGPLLFLVLSWLAPLVLVASVGLYLVLRYDSLAGMLGASGVWITLLILEGWNQSLSLTDWQVVTGGWEYRIVLLLTGILLMVHTLRQLQKLDRYPQRAGE